MNIIKYLKNLIEYWKNLPAGKKALYLTLFVAGYLIAMFLEIVFFHTGYLAIVLGALFIIGLFMCAMLMLYLLFLEMFDE